MNTLWMICLFTIVIHTAETLSYALRYAGVQTGRLAVALSLTGVIVLVSRTSNMIQAPFTGALIDHASAKNTEVLPALHLIIGAASLGTLAAILLFPTLVQLSKRLIAHLEITGSLPQLLRTTVSIHRIRQVKHHIRLPRLPSLARFRIKGIPYRLLLLNCIVTGIYTIGVLATQFASLLVPEFKATVMSASGMINGIATIILTIFIDPQVGLLTDRAMNGQSEMGQVRDIYIGLMISRFFGTLLAQLLLVPAAHWAAWIAPLFQAG
ncbi:lipid II flippase Amj family protein [Brevibacillus composti]|uniref:Lipid II flippase Amj n=1 Tax=Brevibacillus composti TaxID=2796470 RepID=A0A7T5JNN0_9BACL|nr:lipid II flippase Amj family protein [Brevibacillus composti]QQE74252.1 lipid II flippase Amj family protein [Brevibacillus composti]QUO41334.1 lipid II flippase Amj family protein [Brevibacillus composti]